MTKLTALPLVALVAGCCPCPAEVIPAPMPDMGSSSSTESTGSESGASGTGEPAPECQPYCCDAAWEHCHTAPCAEGEQVGMCACWDGEPMCGPDGAACCM